MALAGRRGAVGEYVAEMRVATGAEDFDADHTMAAILEGGDVLWRDGLEETRPARAGVKFSVGGE